MLKLPNMDQDKNMDKKKIFLLSSPWWAPTIQKRQFVEDIFPLGQIKTVMMHYKQDIILKYIKFTCIVVFLFSTQCIAIDLLLSINRAVWDYVSIGHSPIIMIFLLCRWRWYICISFTELFFFLKKKKKLFFGFIYTVEEKYFRSKIKLNAACFWLSIRGKPWARRELPDIGLDLKQRGEINPR